jgi:hypothetical protein
MNDHEPRPNNWPSRPGPQRLGGDGHQSTLAKPFLYFANT